MVVEVFCDACFVGEFTLICEVTCGDIFSWLVLYFMLVVIIDACV